MGRNKSTDKINKMEVDAKKSSDLCKKCGLEESPVASSSDSKIEKWVMCSLCQCWMHNYCVGLPDDFNKNNYLCMPCLYDSNFYVEAARTMKSYKEDNAKTSYKLNTEDLQKINEMIGVQVQSAWTNFDMKIDEALTKHIDQVTKRLDEIMKSYFDKNNVKINKCDERISKLEAKCEELTGVNQSLQESLSNIKSHSLASNIIIRGLPTDMDVNRNTILNIAALIKSNIQLYDICWIKRSINLKSITVSFAHAAIKSNFLKCYYNYINKGKRRIKLADILDGALDSYIYINEQLDSNTHKIYMRVKELKKKNGISHFLIRQGKINIKLNGRDDYIVIKSLEHLNESISS